MPSPVRVMATQQPWHVACHTRGVIPGGSNTRRLLLRAIAKGIPTMTFPVSNRTVLECPHLHVSSMVSKQGDHRRLLLHGRSPQLHRIARAHRVVRSPYIPTVLRHRHLHDSDQLLLDCDAVVHLGDVITLLAENQVRPSLAISLALHEMLLEALESAHAAQQYLGALCPKNVLVGPSGNVWLLGLGHNFPAMRHAAGFVEAPEVFFGSPATATSDVYALFAWTCAMLPLTPPPKKLRAALSGAAAGPLRGVLHNLRTDALALDPSRRPASLAELRARYRIVRRVTPALLPPADYQGLRHLIARAVQTLTDRWQTTPSTSRPIRPPDADQPTLQVTPDLSHLVVDGCHAVDLSTRIIIRRLLARLIHQHHISPGQPLTLQQLQQAGWPDERMMHKAARARIYVAVSTLRKLGLRQIIIKDSGGYCLDPHTLISKTQSSTESSSLPAEC